MCSLDVAQPFATVRNRPREARMAVPMASSSKGVTFGGFKGVTFGGFKRRIASFRVAGVSLCEIQTCFVTCGKLCGRCNTLETIIVILRGRRSTLDVKW